MQRIAVVYDLGAASVVEIVAALEGLAEPIFVCPESEHGEQPVEIMAEFGQICSIGGISLDEAVAKLQAEHPDGIITFSEYQLKRTALLAAELGLPFHSPELTEKLTRKSLQRKILNDCGASSVRTQIVTGCESAIQALETISLPAVLKPDVGTGSRSTYRICSPQELLDACNAEFPDDSGLEGNSHFVLESEMQGIAIAEPWGDYVSVESAVFDGAITHLAVTGKFPLAPPFRETGSFLPAELRDTEKRRVLHVATQALKSLDVRFGICHTEVKFTPSGPQVIEVNGRLGGRVSTLLERASGLDVIRLAAHIALGESDAFNDTRKIQFHRIAFMYAHVPPIESRYVKEIRGIEQLYAMPGISRAIAERRVGDTADWRTGRLGHIYTCFGVAADYAELSCLLDEVRRTVEVFYE